MKRVLSALLITVTCVACGRGGDDKAAQQGQAAAPSVIAIDGSSTVFPIGEAVAEEFQRANRGARVTVGTSGTGGGFEKFCRGETDLSNASRPIKAAEAAKCQSAGVEFIELPLAYDGLSIVVNPKNTWASAITVAELKRLWQPEAQGQIKKWSQIRQGWPDREIHLFGAGTDSGTFDYFTEVIVGKVQSSRGDYTASEDDNVLVQGVAGDENALGYFGYAYYENNKDKVKLVGIDDGKGGVVLPAPDSIRNGSYKPLSRPLFMYVNKAKLQRPEVKSFVDFLMAQGGPLVREVGYVPLSDTEQQMVKDRWTAGRTGSMYGEGGAGANTPLEQALKSGR